jgi:hypothetical protein
LLLPMRAMLLALLLLLLLFSTPAHPRASKKARRQKQAKAEATRRAAEGLRLRPSHVGTGILTTDECARIVREVEQLGSLRPSGTNVLEGGGGKQLTSSGVGGLGAGAAASSTGTDTTVRTSEVTALSRTQFKWVYERMEEYLSTANDAVWGYSHLGEMEDIQIAHYGGDVGGHYTWHPDAVITNKYGAPEGAMGAKYGGDNRLLSASVQLSDASAYEGGDLQIGAINATRTRGAVVVFPSYQLHKVHPVHRQENEGLAPVYQQNDAFTKTGSG